VAGEKEKNAFWATCLKTARGVIANDCPRNLVFLQSATLRYRSGKSRRGWGF
jgi:hypothetical protein